jgi:hypothetical protein
MFRLITTLSTTMHFLENLCPIKNKTVRKIVLQGGGQKGLPNLILKQLKKLKRYFGGSLDSRKNHRLRTNLSTANKNIEQQSQIEPKFKVNGASMRLLEGGEAFSRKVSDSRIAF